MFDNVDDLVSDLRIIFNKRSDIWFYKYFKNLHLDYINELKEVLFNDSILYAKKKENKFNVDPFIFFGTIVKNNIIHNSMSLSKFLNPEERKKYKSFNYSTNIEYYNKKIVRAKRQYNLNQILDSILD